MQILIISLLSACVFVSCKFDKTYYSSCKDFCTRPKLGNNIEASVTIPGDYRCFKMRQAAYSRGQELGFCYAGPHSINGVDQDTTDPDPVACKALRDAANEECKKLPPDPSQMNQAASGSAIFKDGKPVLINGKPVKINGEVCTCTEEKNTGKKNNLIHGSAKKDVFSLVLPSGDVKKTRQKLPYFLKNLKNLTLKGSSVSNKKN